MYRNEITLAMDRNTEFPCIDTVIKKAEDLQYKDYSVKSLITTLKKAKDTNQKLGNRLFIVELNEDESWVLKKLGCRTELVKESSYGKSFYPDYGSSYLFEDDEDKDNDDEDEDPILRKDQWTGWTDDRWNSWWPDGLDSDTEDLTACEHEPYGSDNSMDMGYLEDGD